MIPTKRILLAAGLILGTGVVAALVRPKDIPTPKCADGSSICFWKGEHGLLALLAGR